MLAALFHGSFIAFAVLYLLETSSEQYVEDFEGTSGYGNNESDEYIRMINKQLGQKD